jgi:hypothetical protein
MSEARGSCISGGVSVKEIFKYRSSVVAKDAFSLSAI